ncbi:MAG: DUF2283 domain-containing protein [Ignavibacteriae bacterium]|nr:DUF2283 domain-containing protein [Ignavibacteriota bacterium]
MGAMRIWYDEEGDYLEIRNEENKGYMKDIGDDMWQRVDEKGNVIGFGILGFKKRLQGRKGEIRMPLSVTFT